eukprot:TRINITY_DN26972_c0_g1_i1.p1 TRINITY_DN26972_c0_g1~~TRINITY_DN26972_c0_g1_i1.p1  ORF type:complete len:161 (-),score=41.19 TRINITY_DN26972_c0_g1_i1:830-1312(-)
MGEDAKEVAKPEEIVDPPSGKKLYTLEDVAKHSASDDCWLVIGGKVYDVTKYLEEHPGGDEVMLAATGKDATDDFEDVGHSKNARQLLDEYYVGEFDVSSVKNVKAGSTSAAAGKTRATGGGAGIFTTMLQVLVPVAILALAIYVRYLTKKDAVPKSSSS